MLRNMLEAAAKFSGYQIAIAGAPSVSAEFYEEFISDHKNVSLISNQTHQLLAHASMALVTSGTATLETALFKVPQVVCYSGNSFSYLIAKKLIDVKYISLVNLIVEKPLVTELIQRDFNVKNLVNELNKLKSEKELQRIRSGYDELQRLLGQGGASAKAARLMVSYLKQNDGA